MNAVSTAVAPVFPGAVRSPAVDQVALEERAASLGKRSIKKETKVAGIRLAISMCDLTTLEGKDSPGKIRQICAKAIRPDPEDPSIPAVAAVCVYSDLVAEAKRALALSGVKVASVGAAFPSGRSPLPVRLADVRRAIAAGADEIDMVIDRGAFLAGDYRHVFDGIVATKDACVRPDGSAARLKVILETGELETYDNVRRASDLAIAAGADFIKTSTGKVAPAATPAVTLCMLEAIRDHWLETGVKIGMKPAGGIRSSKQALHYLVLVKETLGADWLTPDLFRFGASSLLNDLLMQLKKEASGRYRSEEEFTKD